MRFEANGPWLLLLCVLVAAASAAQPKAQTQEGLADGQRASRADASSHESLSQSLLLNPSDGLSVIGAALESRGRGRSKPDCSHLVHTVYGRAGFPYSYVSSSDRYARAAATESRESKIGTPTLTPTSLEASANTVTRSSVNLNPVGIELPRVQVINSARPKPEEVTQALLPTLSMNPEALRESDVFKLAPSLIVFSRLEVRAVKIHGDQGRAEVRIIAPVSIAGGQANLRTRQEVQTWPLRRRDQTSWELMLPQDAIYMSRDTAVRVLAHQLALLADTENPSANLRQKSQLARILNTLLME